LIREAIDTLSQKEKEVIWAMSQFTCAAIINGPRLRPGRNRAEAWEFTRKFPKKSNQRAKATNIAVLASKKTHTGGKMKSRDPLNRVMRPSTSLTENPPSIDGGSVIIPKR